MQTGPADSESPPGEESNGTTAAQFREVDGNQYLIIDNLPSQNTATCRIEEPPDPTINENPIVFVHDQPDENFELESVKTELEEGQRRFWEPGSPPWIADDYESGIISVIWNVLTEIQNDSQTVGIILKKDNEGGLIWMNEDDFRARYAERILQNENDIRTLYYILNVILDEIGEELLIQTFSNSINLDPVCWFYWRVSPQNLQIVPYTDIGGFIDKTRNLRNSFEVYHDKFLNMIQRMLENGQQQADTNIEEIRNMADRIEARTKEVTDEIEANINSITEYREEMDKQNQIVIAQGMAQMEEYLQQVQTTRQQLNVYINDTQQRMNTIIEEAIQRQNAEEQNLIQERQGFMKATATLNFIKANFATLMLKAKLDTRNIMASLDESSMRINRQTEDFKKQIEVFNAKRREINNQQNQIQINIPTENIQETSRALRNSSNNLLSAAQTAIDTLNQQVSVMAKNIREQRLMEQEREQEVYDSMIETVKPILPRRLTKLKHLNSFTNRRRMT